MNLTLRLPEEIYKELRNIALEEERSINGQIVYILKQYIEDKKK